MAKGGGRGGETEVMEDKIQPRAASTAIPLWQIPDILRPQQKASRALKM